MRTKVVGALIAAALSSTAASAQSLSPMVDKGVTFVARKGVMIVVANPYSSTQKFVLEPYEPSLSTVARGVNLQFTEITLASNAQRRVRVIFDIPGKEREIAICVRPETEETMVVPRVCGRYYGRRAGR